MNSPTQNFAVPLAKNSINLPESNTSPHSEMSLSTTSGDPFYQKNSKSYTEASIFPKQQFFKEPVAISTPVLSAGSSSMMTSDFQTFTFNEDEEDDENEDELYGNFVDSQGQSMFAPGGRSYMESNSFGRYASSSYGRSQQSFGQLESVSNSQLTKSYPPPSAYPSSGSIHHGDPLSSSFLQTGKQLSTPNPEVSFDNSFSNSSTICVCYWLECYKQFHNQSQLVSFTLIILLCMHYKVYNGNEQQNVTLMRKL